MVDVIDWQPPTRAAVRVVSPAPDVPTRVTFPLQAIDSGCLFVHGIEFDLAQGEDLVPGYEAIWHEQSSDMFERLRAVLGPG